MPKAPRPRRGARKRYRFTRDDCRRGYQAALAKCMQSWDLYAWFYYRVRGWYRHKRRTADGDPDPKGDDPCV
jgi:hypothetical protein